MKAVGKYIVIKPIKESTKVTSGGLMLNEKSREDVRYRQAEVEVIGDEVQGIKIKDKVYYDKHAGFTLELEGELKTIIKEFDIVVVL